MKFVALAILAFIGTSFKLGDDDCPEEKQIKCTDDIRAAYIPCKKAAEAGGSDSAADLQCLKYYSKMKSDCWSCICMVAHEEHFDIKGC